MADTDHPAAPGERAGLLSIVTKCPKDAEPSAVFRQMSDLATRTGIAVVCSVDGVEVTAFSGDGRANVLARWQVAKAARDEKKGGGK